MKLIGCLLAALFFYTSTVNAQGITVSVDRITGDSIFTTHFDTLHSPQKNESDLFPDKVVGVKTSSKGKNTYWLFFYFSTADITHKPVKISKKNYAYFVKPNNEYLRIPYSGKSFNYNSSDNAGFFVDVTQYINKLSSTPLKAIRLETSVFYHEIPLAEKKQDALSDIIRVLD